MFVETLSLHHFNRTWLKITIANHTWDAENKPWSLVLQFCSLYTQSTDQPTDQPNPSVPKPQFLPTPFIMPQEFKKKMLSKRQLDKHAHFTQWLSDCPGVWRWEIRHGWSTSHTLIFYSYKWVQPHECLFKGLGYSPSYLFKWLFGLNIIYNLVQSQFIKFIK